MGREHRFNKSIYAISPHQIGGGFPIYGKTLPRIGAAGLVNSSKALIAW